MSVTQPALRAMDTIGRRVWLAANQEWVEHRRRWPGRVPEARIDAIGRRTGMDHTAIMDEIARLEDDGRLYVIPSVFPDRRSVGQGHRPFTVCELVGRCRDAGRIVSMARTVAERDEHIGLTVSLAQIERRLASVLDTISTMT